MTAVTLRRRAGVAWLRPADRRSAATERLVARDLAAAAEELRFDADTSVVALAGGRDFFFSGAAAAAPAEVAQAVEAVAALTQPVIGVLAGAAVGDGAALALACDVRLAARGALIAFPKLGRGVLPDCGTTQRLPRTIGRSRALELLLSGRQVGAAEALRIGLFNQLESPGRLATAARRYAEELAQRGPIALRFAKEAVLQGIDLTLPQGIRLEQDLYVLLQTTADRAEGIRSFRARRKPHFRGR